MGESLIALAVVRGNGIAPATGKELRDVKGLASLSTRKKYPVTFSASFHEYAEPEYCIYRGLLADELYDDGLGLSNRPADSYEVKRWDLFTNYDEIKINTEISPTVKSKFEALDDTCVVQDDQEPGEPCRKPELLATSDLNNNGRLEFWHTVPHKYWTGFAIAELNESGDSLNVLIDNCQDYVPA